MSESNVYRHQNLMTKVDPRAVRFLYQIHIYAKSTCVHALLQWRYVITCVVENREPGQ